MEYFDSLNAALSGLYKQIDRIISMLEKGQQASKPQPVIIVDGCHDKSTPDDRRQLADAIRSILMEQQQRSQEDIKVIGKAHHAEELQEQDLKRLVELAERQFGIVTEVTPGFYSLKADIHAIREEVRKQTVWSIGWKCLITPILIGILIALVR